MKKNFYAIGVLLMLISSAGAQQMPCQDAPFHKSERSLSVAQHVDEAYRGTPIWSEDFGNGFPSGWLVDDQSGICPWVWSTDGSYGYYNGSNGATSGDTIMSTTAANGFLINDPDSANHVNYGQPSGTTYQYLTSYFETDTIDLTGFTDVILEFQQYFRYNNSISLDVMVSGDGGTTWTTYDVSNGQANNQASTNPDIVKINISPVAGNASEVLIRIGWSARVYHWQIDDMMIYEAPAHDLEFTEAKYYTQQTNYWGYNIPYATIPSDQVLPIEFSSRIANGGASTESNVMMNVDVMNSGGSSVFTTSSTSATLMPTDTLDAVGANTFTTTTIDNYSVEMTVDYTDVALDATPGDLIDTASFSVSDCEYARDLGIFSTNGLWNGDDGSGSSNSFQMGNLYQFQNDFDLSAIRIAIDNTSDAGSFIYGIVYHVDQNTGDRNVIYDGSGTLNGEIEVTGSMINSAAPIIWTDLCIDQGNGQPLTLQAGEEYIVCVGHYGGPEYFYVMRGNTSEPMTTFLLDGTDNTWYYMTSTPNIRAVGVGCTSCLTSVDELNSAGLTIDQNRPNPFSEDSRIDYTLDISSNITFEVVDVAGKVVERRDLGVRSPGEYSIILDGSKYEQGMYFYTFTTEKGSQTKRMVVNR